MWKRNVIDIYDANTLSSDVASSCKRGDSFTVRTNPGFQVSGARRFLKSEKTHMLRCTRPIARQRTKVRLRSSTFVRLASELFLSSLQFFPKLAKLALGVAA
jgi:hypothetical protein